MRGSRARAAAGILLASLGMCLGLVALAHAQEQNPTGEAPADGTAEAKPLTEIGGRLVISGETVEVVADPDLPPESSSIATKTATPLLETPRSVSVVDRQALDDLAAINLTQAHDFTLGFTPEDERGPGFARGFRVGFYDLRRDGLRTYSWSVREPAALDRIQYLRGPAAVLYGDGSPGGLVNLVLKKPLPAPRYGASVSAGGLGFRRGTLDATGPLTASRRVRYRLVAAAEGLEDGFDNDETRVSVLPMLSFDLGEGTTLHVDGEFYDQRGRGYRHAVPSTPDTQRGDFSRLPWDLNMASPDDHWRGWNVSGGLRLDSRLGKKTSLHVAARYTDIVGDLDFQALLGLSPDGRTALRGLYREESRWHEYQSDSFVTTSATTGPISHRLVAGLEAGYSTTDSRIGIGPAPPLDIYDPVYGPRPPEPATSPSANDILRVGVYVQDQAGLARKLTLVPALRWNRLRVEDRTAAGTPPATDTAVSPSLGLVFLPHSWLSLYASYSQGFEPPTPGQYLEGGRPLAPLDSASIEAGVKSDLLRGRLAVSGALYRLRQTNVAEFDPAGFYRQIGEGESTGVELELVGSPARGIAVRGAYAWTRAEITRDVAGFEGRALPNAPRHKANLWVRYRQPEGRLRSLTLGAGLVYVSERFTSRDNSVRLPAYTRIDAAASVELMGPRLSLGLAAQNLGNTRYVTSGARSNLFAGAPRRLALSLTSAF